MNLSGNTVKAAVLTALAVATVLTQPIQPPRTYSGTAAVMPSDPPVIRGHAPALMPSDPPVIRDHAAALTPSDSPIIRDRVANTMCTGTPDCNGGPLPHLV